jgi:hypothetical protein
MLDLQWIPLKIYRLQILLVRKLLLHLVEAFELAPARPQLFQILQCFEAGEMYDGVNGDINDAEICVFLEAGERGDDVV